MLPLKKAATVIIITAVVSAGIFGMLSAQEIPVLMYHFVGSEREAQEDSLVVSERTFEQHLKHLDAWGYRTLSLDEYDYYLRQPKWFPGKVILITFDDGNFSFHDRVYPLLKRYQKKAANFLVADSLLNQTHGSMSEKQAKFLSESPLITFGSHTTNHKILKNLSDQELREEIVDSKAVLSRVLGKEIFYFCYPGGYFDNSALEIVKKTGYKLAFTTSYKRLEGRQLNAFSIPRIKMAEKDQNPILFWFKISGVYSAAQSLRFQLARLIHLS